MTNPRVPPRPARIRLYPARRRGIVMVLRRNPKRLFHVLRWNTLTDELEPGSWFHGMIQEFDISFDGQWILYAARGSSGNEWTGVSRAPFLKTILESANPGPWHMAGGLWRSPNTLVSSEWEIRKEPVPFQTQTFE